MFRHGLAAAVHDPDDDHWSDSPPSAVRLREEKTIRPDCILALFIKKSKTFISQQPAAYLFVITTSEEGACCPTTSNWAEGRALRMWGFCKFHRNWQQSRGRRSKSKPQPRGQVSLVWTQREQPGSRHRPTGQAARAQRSTTSDTMAYFGLCLFYNWNLVATITFKLRSAHYVISKQHWNEIHIWKLWFLGPSTWKWWCQRPIYRISIP